MPYMQPAPQMPVMQTVPQHLAPPMAPYAPHAAVAAYVASGMADASFGVEAAARQFGLDFVRLITEDYYFVCREELLATAPMRRLLDIMRGKEFQDAVAALPGYAAVDTGVIKTIDDAFEGPRRKQPRRRA